MIRIIAHRGASAVAPENTLLALQRAQEAGVQWVEVDVRRCADGAVVLAHDADWIRLAGRPDRVHELSWPATQALELRSAASHARAAPARLDEALARFPLLHFDVELKEPEHDPGLVPATLAVVRTQSASSRVVLSSFDHACIDRLAFGNPDLALAYIATAPLGRLHPRVTICALQAELLERDAGLVPALVAQGRRVWTWTVDDLERAHRLVRLGVDGIITNDPERLQALGDEP